MDTLKEAAQSGWTQTWELIAGDFEEAKALFTEISDAFGAVIQKSADARNALLGEALSGPEGKWEQLTEKVNAAGIATEDFQKIYNRKPEKLKVSINTRERDYHEYARGSEAFFGDNNEYKITMISLFAELRSVYQEAVSDKNNKKTRTDFSKKISPILKKIEKCVEKTFNISRCYFGLIDDLNAWCIPMCFDANLVTKKNGHTHVNEKLKVSLEDIVETKNGYKYKTPDGKIYCVSFGIHFLAKKNGKDLFTDEECVAVMTHEFGHAMQHAICSINENLASVYIHSLFEDIYNLLNPIVFIFSLGFSGISAIFEHKTMKDIREDDPEYIGSQIIKEEIGANRKDYDREYFGEMIDTNTHDVSKS